MPEGSQYMPIIDLTVPIIAAVLNVALSESHSLNTAFTVRERRQAECGL